MNNFKNFTPYTPGEDKSELIAAGVAFIRDEDGHDWYECQKLFSENTVKIAYDSNNIIVSIASDVSTLWPLNLSVSEVDSLPDDVDINGNWMFKGGEVVKRVYTREEEQQKAENKRQLLLQQASEYMAPLQDAADLSIATEEEISRLTAWKRYRVLLNRIDTSTAPDIEWPDAPE